MFVPEREVGMKLYRSFLLVAIALLVLVPCAQAVHYDYEVVVTDGVTQQPVAGAVVTLAGATEDIGVTSTSGVVVFLAVPEGEYLLTVQADGYGVVSEKVTVDATERRRNIGVW
jgi:hypothetical protein